MSKLIGTNPNQVPSNADLGTAAFMDKKEFLLSKGSEMSAIDAVIPKTAVDVFIYDTTKDSDGGAWRKRTQHTSWYNEKLNTTTRGSRKEFPVVAVIVVESAYVTIYDGDDPALPMWMGFPDASYAGHLWENAPSCVHALNAKIAVGSNPYDLNVVDFIADKAVSYSNDSVISGTHKFPISGRAPATGSYSSPADVWTFNTGVGNIINRYVNDVAMTVLPNAPIDSVTGLPVPTIAVATTGGVSVIRDDGNVVDINYASYTASRFVSFTAKNYLVCNFDNVTTNGRFTKVYRTIPSSDQSSGGTPYNSTNGEDAAYTNDLSASWQGDLKFLEGLPTNRQFDNFSFAHLGGLLILDENEETPSKGMLADITSDFNTGWMNGDIKLATLSDTDTANAGAEIITNGDFATDSDWSKGAGWTISGGKATHDSTTGNRYLNQAGILTAGKQYVLIFTISNYTSGVLRIYGSTTQPIDITEGNATYTIPFIATGTGDVNFQSSVSGAFIGSIDNVSCKLAEQDRSVNGNGLQVLGTVTKTPVAVGADLVAYSGFSSSSNLLKQPNNSNLDIGSDDFCVTLWTKITSLSSTQMPWSLANPTVNNNRTAMYVLANGDVRFFLRQSSAEDMASSGAGGIVINSWTHVCVMRKGNTLYIYINGEMKGSVATSKDITQVGKELKIGADWDGSVNANASSLALFRFSATAPSAEQIKKMYNDEKVLFQENAKATLYGTSDAVTALAYDDDAELLHVGTSAGRSDFQGLRRINNTTRAIGTAISAVDGFIVEE